jgi:hypothetical protein
VPLAQPGDQLGAAGRCHDHTGGVLVCGRHHDRVGVRRGQGVDAQAEFVDRHPDRFQAGAGGDLVLLPAAGVLEGDAPGAPGGEGAADQAHAVQVAVGDDHAVR